MCPRRSVAGAWSRVGASGCWSSGGAAFAIFNSGFGGKYVVIFEWKTLGNKSRLKYLCFKRRIIAVCNETKRKFLFGTEMKDEERERRSIVRMVSYLALGGA